MKAALLSRLEQKRGKGRPSSNYEESDDPKVTLAAECAALEVAAIRAQPARPQVPQVWT